MTGNNLFDTNIVIELFEGNPTITAFLETLEEEINIPFAVLGELYLGAYRSANPKKHSVNQKADETNCQPIDV